jgi:hypothetical protein
MSYGSKEDAPVDLGLIYNHNYELQQRRLANDSSRVVDKQFALSSSASQ